MINPEVESHIGGLSPRNQIVLYGAETHVCVKQTAFDLLERGFEVHLVIDAVSSMCHHDRNTGIESMKQVGVQVTTFQSLAFELMKDS